MAVLTPGGTNGWNLQKWQRTIESATYQKKKFIPLIDEGDRPFGTLNIRKHARVAGTTLGQSADGLSLSYLTIIGTPITVQPVGNVVPVAWSENEDAQLDVNLDSEGRSNIEAALAEQSDDTALAVVSGLGQVMTQASVDAAMFRVAYGRLMGNTNGMAEPGEKPQVYGIFSHRQYPNLASIEEFNQADVRGDSENPFVKGMFTKASGVLAVMSTVVDNDGTADQNCLFLPSAFVVAWNVRSRLKKQEIELQNRLIAYNNFGVSVKHDLRAIALRTTASGI